MKWRLAFLVVLALTVVLIAPVWPLYCSYSGDFLKMQPLWEVVANRWYGHGPATP